MALPLSAKRALLGLLIIVKAGITLGDSGCACEVWCAQTVAEHRREIARLEDEVRALRGARRTAAPEVQCDADWVVTSDSEVEALQGCRTVRTLSIEGGQHVTSLVALGSLEAAENVLIKGNLKLKSLAGLEKLARVEQRLLVEANARLPSLMGLQGLHTAGKIDIVENNRLSDISGLEGLRTVGSITLESNDALSSLQGLQGLHTAGKIDIVHNDELSNLSGLEGLGAVENVSVKHNDALSSLQGLQGIRSARELHIQGGPLADLTGLDNLNTVDTMTVDGCLVLQDLTGLENLQTIDKLTLDRNFRLQSLTALESLTRVNVLLIRDSSSLRSLRGLEGLTRVDELNILNLFSASWGTGLNTLNGLESLTTASGGVTIRQLQNLSSLSGLQGLQSTRRLHIEDNKNLVTLSGLENLESVHGELSIKKLPALQSLDGLESLTSVETLTLERLDELRSLAGLQKLTSAPDGVFIHAWPNLRSLEGLGALQDVGALVVVGSQLKYLGAPFASGAEIKEVHIDRWPPCLTAQEHLALLSVVEHMGLSSLPQNSPLWPQWQPACDRASFGTFSCTRGHRCSFSLLGKDSNYTSVFISDRFTGCGFCTGDRVQGEVTSNDIVDLDYALKGQEGGLRSICRCAGGAAELGPVAQLLLRGPRQSSLTVCARGLNCTLELDGEDLESADRVVLMSHCAGDPLLGFAASWIAEKVYLLHDPATWHKAPPALYEVCWRAPCSFTGDGPTCPAPEDSYIHISDVELRGTFSRRYTLVLGEDLVAANIGRGVADGDWMRILRVCGESNEEGTGVSASSSGQLFDFGRPKEEDLQPGSYYLCWCQAGPGVECNGDRDFASESGTLRVLCPAGQEPAGSRCQACRAGRQRLEPGLEPCSLCPAGHSSLGGNAKCEACQDGTVAEGTGSSACIACRAWESAGAEATGCFPDPAMFVLLASFYLSVGAVCTTLVRTLQRRLPVVDVSLDQKCTVVTTFGPHGFSDFGRPSFPVTFRDTGHPGLDEPSEPFRVRVRDAVRLELLTWSGQSIDRRLDTSMGTLVAAFPHDLYHQGWRMSMALYVPALFITVLALGGLVLAMGLVLEGLVGAAAAALGFTAASVPSRWRPRITPLKRRVSEFKQKLAFRPSRCCEKGPKRAIAIGKLYELLDFFRDHIRDRSAYYLDSNILRPLTKEKAISYAELVGAEPVDWFVSHFWGTAFEHFCTALQKHAQTVCGQHAWSTLCYWVCFCSNNQHRIKEELGQGWEDSSFYLTLKNGCCRGTCMVLDDQALPLTRVWCIFELLQTIKLERSEESFQGLLLCTSGGVLNTGSGSVEVAMALAEKVAQMDLEAAQASSESDALMIRQQVMTEMGSYAELNHFIRGEVGNMLVRAQSSANQHFAAVLAHLGIDAGNQVPAV